MTKLDELLEQIELDEIEAGEHPEEWGDGVFEMPFTTAKTLLKIVEAAFQIVDLWAAYGEMMVATGTVGDLKHNLRGLKELKKELEDVPKESS